MPAAQRGFSPPAPAAWSRFWPTSCSGWDSEAPFVDPLCGSGTLPIEAAWIALRRPPGLTRKRFGFMGWLDYDVRLWTSIRDDARAAVLKQLSYAIVGSDIRADAVEFARTNART